MTEYTKPVSEEVLNHRAKEIGAARVTLEALLDNIVGENYFTAAQGAAAAGPPGPDSLAMLTLCVLTLRNGFTVVGQSACADPKNFNAEIGQQIAKGDAIRQVWPLMGYELRSKMTRLKNAYVGDIDEALTRLQAFEYGNPEAFRVQDAKKILGHFSQEHIDG